MQDIFIDDYTFKKNILKIKYCYECVYFQIPNKKNRKMKEGWGWCSLHNKWVQANYTQCDEVNK